jgi:hypothetical protein
MYGRTRFMVRNQRLFDSRSRKFGDDPPPNDTTGTRKPGLLYLSRKSGVDLP